MHHRTLKLRALIGGTRRMSSRAVTTGDVQCVGMLIVKTTSRSVRSFLKAHIVFAHLSRLIFIIVSRAPAALQSAAAAVRSQ